MFQNSFNLQPVSKKLRDMPNQSKTTLSDYPLLEIFSYLPIQTIAKFRFVCKDWYRLITGPFFLRPRSFLLLCPSNVKLACMVDPSSSTLIPTPINIPLETATLIGSSNGLICLLSDHNYSAANHTTISYYYVCNPITRETVEIERICLRNKPSWVTTTNGFTFDPTSKTYKIVCASYYYATNNDMECKVEIHALGSNQWGTVDKNPNACFSSTTPAFVNGALHWKLFGGGVNRIGAIDIGRETFREFEEPPLCNGIQIKHLVSIKDCLSMITHQGDGDISVWIMKEYGVNKSWVKGYELRNKCGSFIEDVSICGQKILRRMMNGSGLVVNSGYYEVKDYYDFENSECRYLVMKRSSVNNHYSPYAAVIHAGCLVSPKELMKKIPSLGGCTESS